MTSSRPPLTAASTRKTPEQLLLEAVRRSTKLGSDPLVVRLLEAAGRSAVDVEAEMKRTLAEIARDACEVPHD